MASIPVLGYWNIRGIAQPIRLMLAYAEQPFEDKRYAFGPPPEFSRGEWSKDKFALGLDFPNLPYYIDGDLKLTQSINIMRYLGRKLKLEPTTEEEKIRAHLIEQQTIDFRQKITKPAYDPNYETLLENYVKSLPQLLKLYSEYLGKRNWFVTEDRITYVDFMVYEALDVNRVLFPDCLEPYGNLKEYMDRFEGLPTIAKYMQSDKFLKFPLNGDMAKFGSRYTE